MIICLLDEIGFNLIVEHIFDFALRIEKVIFNLIGEIAGKILQAAMKYEDDLTRLRFVCDT